MSCTCRANFSNYLKLWNHDFPTGNLVSCFPRYA